MSKHVLNTRLPPAASREEAEMRSAILEGNPLPPEDCLHSDEEEFLDELYRNESPKLIRILSRQTSSNDDAHDLVQDVFFKLARMRDRWPSPLERPQAYLRRIASNLLKDRAKAAFRRSAALHVVADEGALPGLDQQRLLESRDMLRRLDAAMMRLRPKTREIFMAHRIDGMTYAEIAERTGLSVKGIEKQMSKALVQLDRMLNRSL
jgi:RNA polymerase sigma factor (sigma-70 family)